MSIFDYISLVKLEDEDEFWSIFDEMLEDSSELLEQKGDILRSFTEGNMYGLRVTNTDFLTSVFRDLDKTFYLLPCFCIKEDGKTLMTWTHSRVDNMGLSKYLVANL